MRRLVEQIKTIKILDLMTGGPAGPQRRQRAAARAVRLRRRAGARRPGFKSLLGGGLDLYGIIRNQATCGSNYGE